MQNYLLFYLFPQKPKVFLRQIGACSLQFDYLCVCYFLSTLVLLSFFISSLNIFISELCKLYNDESLEPLDITYKDFATFENNRLASGELNEAQNYWVNQFKDDIPVLNLPTNYPRPAMQSFEGRKIYSTISSEQTKKLNVLAKS